MPKSAKIFRLRRAKKHLFVVFSCLQIPQNFACGGPKTHIFNVFMHSDPQNFRLRRAKKNPADAVLKMFPRMQERAVVIRETQSETNMRESHCFYGCRNAFLPFGKQNMSRAGAIPVCFTGVGTRHYHSRNQIGAAHCPGTMSAFYGCKNVPLPFTERFISRLSEKPAAGENFQGFTRQDTAKKCIFYGFEMLFESVSEGFLAFWKSKIPKFSPAAILTYKNTPP